MRLGILASGDLGENMLMKIILNYQIDFIATDQKSTNIILFSNKNGIRCFVGNPRNNKLIDKLKVFNCDVLISINYLFLIDQNIINIPKILAFNIHGSLLPKYRGRTPHVWAIINNEKLTGITAHVIDKGCDTGPIIGQVKIDIDQRDTGGDLLTKFNVEYPKLIFDTLEKIRNNTLSYTEQVHQSSSFFGKRTPSDGLINWHWYKERIFNWVRAQSSPYPGAFSLYENEKIIIDEIIYENIGFHQDDENGLIIRVENNMPFIKTPNGIVKITKIRNLKSIQFLELKKFI